MKPLINNIGYTFPSKHTFVVGFSNCFVSHLSRGRFFEFDNNNFFGLVRETAFSKLNQRVHTCFKICLYKYVGSQNTQNSLTSFLRFVLLSDQ